MDFGAGDENLSNARMSGACSDEVVEISSDSPASATRLEPLERVQKLFLQCWHADPVCRPPAGQIAEKLETDAAEAALSETKVTKPVAQDGWGRKLSALWESRLFDSGCASDVSAFNLSAPTTPATPLSPRVTQLPLFDLSSRTIFLDEKDERGRISSQSSCGLSKHVKAPACCLVS